MNKLDPIEQKIIDYDKETKGEVSLEDLHRRFHKDTHFICAVLRKAGRTRRKPKDNEPYEKWLTDLRKQADTYWKGKDRPEDNIVALLMAKYQNIKTVQSILSAWAILSKEDKNIFTFLRGEF